MLTLEGTKLAPPPQFDELAEPVHFSHLKEMALSPAHYRAARQRSKESTRDMRVGTVVHHLVCGPHRTRPLLRYDGEERKGNSWREFAESAPPNAELVTSREWDDAEPIAAAVLRDPVASQLIGVSKREVSLAWKSGKIARATDGIDLVGPRFIADLKRTSCTEPGGFQRHAAKHLWHCQLVDYAEAAEANGLSTADGLFLIGVEPHEPYAVTVMRLAPETIEHAKRCLVKWLEALQVARDNDHWPAYTQTVVEFGLPPWLLDGDD